MALELHMKMVKNEIILDDFKFETLIIGLCKNGKVNMALWGLVCVNLHICSLTFERGQTIWHYQIRIQSKQKDVRKIT